MDSLNYLVTPSVICHCACNHLSSETTSDHRLCSNSPFTAITGWFSSASYLSPPAYLESPTSQQSHHRRHLPVRPKTSREPPYGFRPKFNSLTWQIRLYPTQTTASIVFIGPSHPRSDYFRSQPVGGNRAILFSLLASQFLFAVKPVSTVLYVSY